MKPSPPSLTNHHPLPDSWLSEARITAPVQEVFSSFQGEGPYVGQRQIFVRFAHCHLACAYCDTPMTSPTGRCHIQNLTTAGAPDDDAPDTQLENPLTPEQLLNGMKALVTRTLHHSISLTGGEPLLYHRFLAQLLPLWHQAGFPPAYLETSGTQPDFLQPLLPWLGYVAMDIKLPSATGERAYWEEHRDFLSLSRPNQKPVWFVKLILNDAVQPGELEAVLALLAPSPEMPVILQPETEKTPPLRLKASQATLFRVQTYLADRGLTDVRVIPQTHKLVSVR